MELFDAVYGDAYAAVEDLLAWTPMSRRQLRGILSMFMTFDGAMDAEQKLLDGTWPLLEQDDEGQYASRLPVLSERPLTTLELRWLRSLCEDERAPLFLSDEQLSCLREAVKDIQPLFAPGEIVSYDSSLTGDDFSDPAYRARFHEILRAFREGCVLEVVYFSAAGRRLAMSISPQKLEYSAKDRRFRLHGMAEGRQVILNLSRLQTVRCGKETTPAETWPSVLCEEPLELKIFGERNALARFMLEFSCFKKESTIDPGTGTATARVWYPVKDETEVLIRVLGFGPSVMVTGPAHFVQRVRERIGMQPCL